MAAKEREVKSSIACLSNSPLFDFRPISKQEARCVLAASIPLPMGILGKIFRRTKGGRKASRTNNKEKSSSIAKIEAEIEVIPSSGGSTNDESSLPSASISVRLSPVLS